MFGIIKKLFSTKEEAPKVDVPYKVETQASIAEPTTPGFNYEDVKPQAVVLTPVAKAPAKKKPATKKAPAKKAPAKKAPKK